MKLPKKIILVVAIIFISIQFYSPTKNISPGNHTSTFIKETNPSPEITTLLKTSCYDCHSNDTAYPWYNNIAPISYWMANHVNEGKEHLNFSEWSTYSNDKKDHLLEELEEEAVKGEMPLKEYTWMHGDAKLSDYEVENLVRWIKKTRIVYQLGRQPK